MRGHTREQREDALDEGRALLGDVGGHTLQEEQDCLHRLQEGQSL